MMIPRKAMVKNGYEPDLVLLHFLDMEYDDYLRAYENFNNAFPETAITISDHRSDLNGIGLMLGWGMFGIIMVLILLMSLISIFMIWISEQRKIVYVYRICGLTKQLIKVFMLIEILIFTILGEAAALIMQLLLSTPLSFVGVERVPNIMDILVTVSAAFVFLTAVSFKRISKNLRFEGGFGE